MRMPFFAVVGVTAFPKNDDGHLQLGGLSIRRDGERPGLMAAGLLIPNRGVPAVEPSAGRARRLRDSRRPFGRRSDPGQRENSLLSAVARSPAQAKPTLLQTAYENDPHRGTILVGAIRGAQISSRHCRRDDDDGRRARRGERSSTPGMFSRNCRELRAADVLTAADWHIG